MLTDILLVLLLFLYFFVTFAGMGWVAVMWYRRTIQKKRPKLRIVRNKDDE